MSLGDGPGKLSRSVSPRAGSRQQVSASPQRATPIGVSDRQRAGWASGACPPYHSSDLSTGVTAGAASRPARRKLVEVGACVERLNAVRASLLTKLAAAPARHPEPCTVNQPEHPNEQSQGVFLVGARPKLGYCPSWIPPCVSDSSPRGYSTRSWPSKLGHFGACLVGGGLLRARGCAAVMGVSAPRPAPGPGLCRRFVGGDLQHVPAAPDGSDDKTERTNTPPQPHNVQIQCIAVVLAHLLGQAVVQLLPGNQGLELAEQALHQFGLGG